MLEHNGIVALDTEFTSLDLNKAQVIECSCIFCDKDLNVLDRKTWKINYEEDKYNWSEESESIHKISKEESKNHGVSIEEFVNDLIEKINSIYSNFPKMVGSNIFFDYFMLNRLFLDVEKEFPFNYSLIDTNSIGNYLFGTSGSTELCEILQIDIDEGKEHRAEYDAEKHYKIYTELLKKKRDMIQ